MRRTSVRPFDSARRLLPSVGGGSLARLVALGALVVASASCAPRNPPDAVPDPGAAGVLAGRADGLVARGSYRCLLEGHAIRRALHERAPGSAEWRRARITSALLLALRERQLAIQGDAYLDEAEALLAGCDRCAAERAMAGVVRGVFVRGAGVVRDLAGSFPRPPGPDVLEGWTRALTERAASDVAAAAFLLELARGGPGVRADPAAIEDLVAARPDSPLVLISGAFAGRGDLAVRALDREETMAESYLILGQAARARDPGVAVAELRRAAEGLPRSVAALLSLADLLFALEDYAAALVRYDAVLELAPEHRDAHLHRGQVLHLLGRHRESVGALARLFELGNWYLGETHYWTGLGYRELDDREAAGRHASLARRWLPDDPRVYALAGSLALDAGEPDAAAREFAAAVAGAQRSSKDWSGDESLCESHYSLGLLASRREDWGEGAADYEAAADCYDVSHGRAAAALRAVRGWSLDDARREALVLSRTRRLDRAAHQRAGSLYNAAVCHYRAGEEARARELARRAGTHEAYAERVEKLLAALR